MSKFITAFVFCGTISMLGAAVIDVTAPPNTVQCDGVTDDTQAIQTAINNASYGDTLVFPGNATCLLNTFNSIDMGLNHYNIVVNGGRTLQGNNTTLLQSTTGRPTTGRNTVLAIGKSYIITSYNCATFYPLNAVTAGTNTINFNTPTDIDNFNVGDLVSVYSQNPAPCNMMTSPCDVCNTSVVTSVIQKDSKNGILTLTDNLQRSFSTPWVGNQTSTTAYDVYVNNFIIQGQEPVAVEETFIAAFTNNTFLGDSGHEDILNVNTCGYCTFTNNTIDKVGTNAYSFNEWAQRNSYFDTWTGNTIKGTDWGGGDNAAGMTITGNHFYVEVNSNGCGSLTLGALNSTFSNNDVHTVGNASCGSGQGYIITDAGSAPNYAANVGTLSITNNSIQCQANGESCIYLFANNDTVTGNDYCITGTATFITDIGSGNTTSPNTATCTGTVPHGDFGRH